MEVRTLLTVHQPSTIFWRAKNAQRHLEPLGAELGGYNTLRNSSRAVKLAGTILCRPVLGGLHHQYVRI
jgi:hypothetical protein